MRPLGISIKGGPVHLSILRLARHAAIVLGVLPILLATTGVDMISKSSSSSTTICF